MKINNLEKKKAILEKMLILRDELNAAYDLSDEEAGDILNFGDSLGTLAEAYGLD